MKNIFSENIYQQLHGRQLDADFDNPIIQVDMKS